MKRLLLALLFVSTVGCNDDFSQGWRIDKTRVLGARASVEGDASRASPAPGETFHVDWFVVTPGGTVPVTWRLTACRRADLLKGAECNGPALTQLSGTDRVPSVSVTAPSAAELGDATHLLVFGDIDATNVDYSVLLQTPKQGPNRNPTIGAEDVRLGGRPLTAEDGACGTLPDFAADDGILDLSLTVNENDRELIEGRREVMQLSHFTTAGKLDRLYSVLESDVENRELKVPYTFRRDANPPPEGLLVRFYFGLRDSRGGMDFKSRAICLRQAP